MINIVELDERINKCLSVLQENPRSRIFAALAEAYRRRGDVGRAFSVCKSGLRIHAEYGAAYVVMAKLYLHQNMIDQAREAIARAVELDGPSRATDLVLAETEIEVGEYKRAREILRRLDQAGGHDPTVQSLNRRMQERMRESGGPPPPPGPSGHLPWESPVLEPSLREESISPEGEMACDNPAAVVEEVLHVPRTMLCALWDQAGTLLSARATQAREIGEILDEFALLFAQIESHALGRGWGRLTAVRVEEPHAQWGLLRESEMTALILGTPQMSYAAVARTVGGCLRHLAEGGLLGGLSEPEPAEQSRSDIGETP